MASNTLINSIWVVICVFILFTLGVGISKIYKEDNRGEIVKSIFIIVVQLVLLVYYGYGSFKVNEHFEENTDWVGDLRFGIGLGIFLTHISVPLWLYVFKIKNSKSKIAACVALVVFLVILWFGIFISIAPTTITDGVVKGTSIKDYSYFVFTTLCVIAMVYLATVAKKKEIGYVLALWLVVSLVFIKFMEPKSSIGIDEPYSLSMLTDNWLEKIEFNLYADVDKTREYENYWLPMSNDFFNFSGIAYLLFYIAVVLVPTFKTKIPRNVFWLLSSALLIPFCTWVSNKGIAWEGREEYNYVSSLDLYTNFVRGTHKEWSWDAYNFLDKVRLLIRLVIFVCIYGVPMFMGYTKLPKPFNFAAILVWILVFPLLLSKLISHDCILSGDTGLVAARKFDDPEKEIELALHQHGGGITILTLIIIGVIKIIISLE